MNFERLDIIHNWRQAYQTTPDGKRRNQYSHPQEDETRSDPGKDESTTTSDRKLPPDPEHKIDLTV
ncbi:MAG: hypothetical protein OEM52_12425 [bacterium]|nr:hypothetical protein [bacterium]